MADMDKDTRARLSWMWVFVMLNMIFADILSFLNAEFLEQLLAGNAGGVAITPAFLLAVAAVTEIPIAMVVLSQVLPPRAARWANMIAGVLTIAYVVGGGSAAPHYIFFAAVETLGCLVIVRWAWRWGAPAERERARGPVTEWRARRTHA